MPYYFIAQTFGLCNVIYIVFGFNQISFIQLLSAILSAYYAFNYAENVEKEEKAKEEKEKKWGKRSFLKI